MSPLARNLARRADALLRIAEAAGRDGLTPPQLADRSQDHEEFPTGVREVASYLAAMAAAGLVAQTQGRWHATGVPEADRSAGLSELAAKMASARLATVLAAAARRDARIDRIDREQEVLAAEEAERAAASREEALRALSDRLGVSQEDLASLDGPALVGLMFDPGTPEEILARAVRKGVLMRFPDGACGVPRDDDRFALAETAPPVSGRIPPEALKVLTTLAEARGGAVFTRHDADQVLQRAGLGRGRWTVGSYLKAMASAGLIESVGQRGGARGMACYRLTQSDITR